MCVKVQVKYYSKIVAQSIFFKLQILYKITWLICILTDI